MKELESKMHRLAEELYKNAQAAQGGPQPGAGPEGAPGGAAQTPPQDEKGGDDDDVIDADFRMMDDDS
jgi:hypothetical protein